MSFEEQTDNIQEKAFKDISYPSNIFRKVRHLKSGEFHLEIPQILLGHMTLLFQLHASKTMVFDGF